MSTSVKLDDDLVEEVRKIGGHKTKKAAVIAALNAYVQRHNQLRILDLFGTVEYDEDYDYKKLRHRKPK